MIFRKATRNDVQAIVKMLADDELGIEREKYQIPLSQEYYRAFKNINDDTNQELIVIEDNNSEIIGTLQLSFIQYLTYKGGVRAQIEAVRVGKENRGMGLGTKLFDWVIQRAKKRKAHVIQLTTDKKRPEALKFYQNLGFVDSHEGMKMHLGQ